MSKKIEQMTEDLVLRVLPDEYEMVDVEYVKENGEIDKDDYINDTYNLEISSPGLDRTLKKDRDFIREKGKDVEVKLFKPLEYGKDFIAILDGLDEQGNVMLDVNNNKFSLSKKDIAKINLYIEI